MHKPLFPSRVSVSRAFAWRLASALAMAAMGCGSGATPGSPGAPDTPNVGATEFASAPPPGAYVPGVGGASGSGLAGGGSLAVNAGTAAPQSSAATASSSTPRTVQETDLYRFDAGTNRLYYLNSYRGLMVFDLTNVDAPKLLGRYPIVGSPVQMFVNGTIAVIVVADWYGTVNGGPFYGSIVQGLDATDPTHIVSLGDAKLGGWVQDMRIVGNVLYAVSEDYGNTFYGWGYGGGPVAAGTTTATNNGPSVIVSSVNFANGIIQAVGSQTYPGYGGVFNVTPNSIMLAHQAAATNTGVQAAQTVLQYLDISDPGGAIVARGSITVDGVVEGWGPDNGRWNLDFSDGTTAHSLGLRDNGTGYILAIADFSNPDAPSLDSELSIPSSGWTPATRFDVEPGYERMYLSPGDGYLSNGATPLQVYDLSNAAAPTLSGQTSIPGSVWLMLPSGNQLFALGQQTATNYSSTQVSLNYVDVSNPAAPTLLGTSAFGEGWAWTPAAETFKAFVRGTTLDGSQGMVVLPFSGWDAASQQYNNGVQLIEYTPTTITTAGDARTKGWVERGIFANGRIISLSDLALAVVNYADPMSPTVTAELTLARNVIAAQPNGAAIAEISGSDWWGNDVSQSDVRVLPTADAAELVDESSAPDVSVPGVGGQVFTNGTLVYVVSGVQVSYPCPVYPGQSSPSPSPSECTGWQQQVQVVDTSGGTTKARGVVKLPIDPAYSWYWGWYGFYWNDWYDGGDIVQVEQNALAFRRWHPNYAPNGGYYDASDDLFVVDLSNPDAPSVASTVISSDTSAWWGDMHVVNNTLYTMHYVWPYASNGQYQTVRYYLDAIDLSDRAHPRFKASINVPGVLVGGSDTDPSLLYTIDYQWDSNYPSGVNYFDVVRVGSNGVASLVSKTLLDGWVGNVIVRGTTAYTTTQLYTYSSNSPSMELHQLDLTNPARPVDALASGPSGWGWLLDVEGDRAIVSSGWYDQGLDIYQLSPGAPPAYDQFVRTQGWGVNSIARQDSTLFLSSGDWGVQVVPLQ
jgi:hypothetical protein